MDSPNSSSVRALLEADRAWCAFALADLAPPYCEHSEWHTGGRGLVLVYRGFDPPLLFASGEAVVSGERVLLREQTINQANPLYWPPVA